MTALQLFWFGSVALWANELITVLNLAMVIELMGTSYSSFWSRIRSSPAAVVSSDSRPPAAPFLSMNSFMLMQPVSCFDGRPFWRKRSMSKDDSS